MGGGGKGRCSSHGVPHPGRDVGAELVDVGRELSGEGPVVEPRAIVTRVEFARRDDVDDAGGAVAVEGVEGVGCGRVDELQRAREPLERSTSLQLKRLEGGVVLSTNRFNLALKSPATTRDSPCRRCSSTNACRVLKKKSRGPCTGA
jgi:hypothetical protein